jgi:hypothetical protein
VLVVIATPSYNHAMAHKLDALEVALRTLIDAAGDAGRETTIDRRLEDRRINIDRTWQGQVRWIYITASDDPSLPDDGEDYMLFLGWYSDPPGETFWEGRRLADFAHAQALVSKWVLQGAAPATFLEHK